MYAFMKECYVRVKIFSGGRIQLEFDKASIIRCVVMGTVVNTMPLDTMIDCFTLGIYSLSHKLIPIHYENST